MRVEPELVLRQGRQAVVAASEVDRPGGDHHPYGLGRDDHAMVRSATAISATRAAALSPASRTTTPPTSISIGAGPLAGGGAGGSSSTRAAKSRALSAGNARLPRRAKRRQAVTCCGLTACRRATSTTRLPAANDSVTMRALTSSGQLRRTVGPDTTSSRSTVFRREANKNCALCCKAVPQAAANQRSMEQANQASTSQGAETTLTLVQALWRLQRQRNHELWG